MLENIKVNLLKHSLIAFEQERNYEKLLIVANKLLLKDPKNSDFLLFKLKALEALGLLSKNLHTLMHYVDCRSTDVTGYLMLYKIFMEQDNIAEAIFSLVYAISIDPDDKECQQLLSKLLTEINPKFTHVKLNVLTKLRIGHLSAEIEPWLRNRQHLNEDDENCLYIFIGNGKKAANTYLFDLLKNNVHVCESDFWFNHYVTRAPLLVDEFYEEFPLDLNSGFRGVKTADISGKGIPELLRIYRDYPAVMQLPPDDLELGWQMLAKHGLYKEDKIVCLHLRDSDYMDKFFPEVNWKYHDYRDADISTFKLTVESLIAQGYKVVRIGNGSNQALDLDSPNYKDFCIEHDAEYGDFFEVMLLSLCEFFIATTSGPMGISAMFDTPMLCVNAVPIEHPYSRNSRFIPKRLVQNGQEVSLIDVCAGKTLSAIDKKPILLTVTSKELVDNNYQYIDNNEQDIYQAVKEFESLVTNRTLSDELTPLQRQYIEVLPDSYRHKDCASIICSSFLQQHPLSFFETDSIN